MKQHNYKVQIEWTGNAGPGTSSYQGYRRDFAVSAAGKPTLPGSSDPAFRGDPTRYNPEEFLVAGLSSCHMLWYLHLCSTQGVVVLDYQDEATGAMEEGPDGSGVFTSVQLNPKVRISDPQHTGKALAIHEQAHQMCFIARSVNFPVTVTAQVLDDAVSPIATDGQ